MVEKRAKELGASPGFEIAFWKEEGSVAHCTVGYLTCLPPELRPLGPPWDRLGTHLEWHSGARAACPIACVGHEGHAFWALGPPWDQLGTHLEWHSGARAACPVACTGHEGHAFGALGPPWDPLGTGLGPI